MHIKRSVIVFLGLFLVSFHSVFAANDCIANHFTTDQRPSLQKLKTADDFYHWRSALHVTDASVAKIPLAKRAPNDGPAVLAGFDIDDRAWQYDFLSTLWSQGGCGVHQKTTEQRQADDVYNFKFWQYLDISYYFGHGLLTMPPTMWTNAAHRNGVKSLGTLDLNDVDAYSFVDPEHINATSQVLLDVANTLGFDGYLINYESYDVRLVAALPILMKTLKDKGLTMIWYDSPISGGYANYLNDLAIPFFISAGNFHTNYWWGSGMPQKSYQTLVKYHLENLKNSVFQMGDVYRDKYKNAPANKCLKSDFNQLFTRFKDVFTDEKQTSYYTALGFFAPNWTMFGGDADPEHDTHVPDVATFEQSDAAFWEGTGDYGCGNDDYENVSYFVRPRTVIINLPFYTNFNSGVGQHYFLNAQMMSDGPWSHFTLQRILPTWQNVKTDSSRPTAHAFFDYQTVYEGGSSWKIQDDSTSKASVTFKLFKTNLTTNSGDILELIVNSSANEVIELVVNGTEVLSPSQKKNLQNNWQMLTFELPTKKITECDVQVQPNTTGKISVNLGSLKIYHPGQLPQPQNQQAVQQGNVLTWTLKQPGSVYRVYGKNPAGGYTLLNEVANNTYDLHGNIFNGSFDSSQFSSFIIQEVTMSGDYISL